MAPLESQAVTIKVAAFLLFFWPLLCLIGCSVILNIWSSYYRKTELGTKAARSQLCINLVLRYYANRFNFSAMITLNASFISFGKNDRSIYANHLSLTFVNLAKMFLITFSSNHDACIEATKSAFLILRFLPLRVNANSSIGMS